MGVALRQQTIGYTRNGGSERGDAMLEGALVFLPLMAVLFGIVDVSLAISSSRR
jgi:Flp pilus assembly protein TadG